MNAPVKSRDAGKAAFNAGDAEQVAERDRESKVRDNAMREGLKFIMSDARGRAWMHFHLTQQLFIGVGKHIPPDSFTGNSATFYNSGAKRVGELLAAELKNICRVQYRQMEDEGDSNG